jgi:hypothetical protein
MLYDMQPIRAAIFHHISTPHSATAAPAGKYSLTDLQEGFIQRLLPVLLRYSPHGDTAHVSVQQLQVVMDVTSMSIIGMQICQWMCSLGAHFHCTACSQRVRLTFHKQLGMVPL